MVKISNLLLLVMTLLLTSNIQSKNNSHYSDKTITCIVKGEVIDRPQSNLLLLVKQGENFRVNSKQILINNNTFEFTIEGEYEEPYQLIFYDEAIKGAWNPVTFFTENNTIRMQLYPEEEIKKNKFEGGVLTNEYYEYKKLLFKILAQCHQMHQNYILENFPQIGRSDYRPDTDFILSGDTPDPNIIDVNKEIDILSENDEYYSETAKEVLHKAREAKAIGDRENEKIWWEKFHNLQTTGKHLSERAQVLQGKRNVINNFLGNWQLGYMEENISLITLSELIDCLRLSLDTEPITYYSTYGKTFLYIELFRDKYEKKFPGHPLTEQMNILINSINTIKPGKKYIDFTAPDFEGNEIALSSLIEGKIAFINLWASWCGPCRRKGIELIPVYEEFKDKGFTVVGVAGERDSKDGIRAAEKDKYPWINLLEINNREKIWYKYGIGNAGGGTFLVDSEGTILLIDPKAEEVRKVLAEKLN